MLVYKRASDLGELNQILKLQRQNLPARLSRAERGKEGFVTVSHTLETLGQMNDVCPHIIAKDADKVVGYALCMHPTFAHEIEVLKPMFEQIGSVHPKTETYIVMGQICIDRNYRKRGVFRKLYETMIDAAKPEFNSIITEVDAKNTRSLEAHYAVGFSDLKTYFSMGHEWKLIVLK